MWGFIFYTPVFSGLVHHCYKKYPQTVTSDGSIIMAIEIFSLNVLQKLPFQPKDLLN
jgi:hypothetical protein